MNELRAVALVAAKAVILVVLAIWFAASCAAAYVALFFFWPFLSLAYAIIWAIWRVRAGARATSSGLSLRRRSGRLRQVEVGGSERPLGKRVLVTVVPRFSVELAAPRWVEAVYLIVWAPFVLQGPLFVAASLVALAGREEPRVVVEWWWLAIGALLLAGFGGSVVALVSSAGREFVEPATIGRRITLPFLGRALCLAHADVCAVETRPGPNLVGDMSARIRFIQTGGEPVELLAEAWVPRDTRPSADLLPLAELLAYAARVPLGSLIGNKTELGTGFEHRVGTSPDVETASQK